MTLDRRDVLLTGSGAAAAVPLAAAESGAADTAPVTVQSPPDNEKTVHAHPRTELVMMMQLAGTPPIRSITRAFVARAEAEG